MKRKMLVLFCVLFFAAALLPCHASELLEDMKREANTDSLFEILPAQMEGKEELISQLSEDGFTASGAASYTLKEFFSALAASLQSELGFFCAIILILLLSAYFGSMRHAFLRDTVGDVFEFVCVLALAGVSFTALWEVFTSLSERLTMLAEFIGGMLPITGAVYSLSGGIVSATVQRAGFLSALSVMNAICVSYLFPLLCISFSLCAAGSVSGVDLCSFARFLRRCVSFLCALVFTVLLAVLFFQSSIAASSDTLTLRSARFAVANFVPAVGNLFAESARTVFAAAGVLRSALGILGILVVLWIILSPLLQILVRRSLFSLARAASDALSLTRQSGFLSDCAETMGLALSITLSCGVYFILAFAVFIRLPIGGV